MKNKIVAPILAIVIAAVVLFGGKAILSSKAEANVEIANNKIMLSLLPGSTSFAAEELWGGRDLYYLEKLPRASSGCKLDFYDSQVSPSESFLIFSFVCFFPTSSLSAYSL